MRVQEQSVYLHLEHGKGQLLLTEVDLGAVMSVPRLADLCEGGRGERDGDKV